MLSDEQEAELLQENLLQSSVTLAPHLAPDKITKRLGFISNFLHYIFYKKEYSNAKYETEEDKLRKEGAGMIKVWKQMIKNGENVIRHVSLTNLFKTKVKLLKRKLK